MTNMYQDPHGSVQNGQDVQGDLHAQTQSEVQVEAGGLPQLNVIADGTYTNQIAWLFLTFIVFYFLVAKVAVPKISDTLDSREERIRADLDKAEECRDHAEKVKEAFEASLLDARQKAQKVIAETKEQIAKDLDAANKKLDRELGERIEKAEAEIAKARSKALVDLDSVALEVAVDLVEKLSGSTIAEAKIKKVVASRLETEKEA